MAQGRKRATVNATVVGSISTRKNEMFKSLILCSVCGG